MTISPEIIFGNMQPTKHPFPPQSTENSSTQSHFSAASFQQKFSSAKFSPVVNTPLPVQVIPPQRPPSSSSLSSSESDSEREENDMQTYESFEKSLQERSKLIRPTAPSKPPPHSLSQMHFEFVIDAKGDKDIFMYEGKIPSNRISRYRLGSQYAVGLTKSFNIQIAEDGTFRLLPSSGIIRKDSRQPLFYEELSNVVAESATRIQKTANQIDIFRDFVPISVDELRPDFSAADVELKTKQQYFSEELEKSPHNIPLWLAYISFQDTLSSSKLAVYEKKLLIFEKALQANPFCEVLIIEYMKNLDQSADSMILLKKWDEFLAKTPESFVLLRAYLDFHQTNFKIFHFPSMLDLFASLLKKYARNDDVLMYIMLRLLAFLWQSGYCERTTALVQALIEINFGSIVNAPFKQLVNDFEIRYNDDITSICENSDEGRDFDYLIDTDEIAAWNAIEICRSSHRFLSFNGYDDEDLHRMVLFEDIREFLININRRHVKPMVSLLFGLLGLPIQFNTEYEFAYMQSDIFLSGLWVMHCGDWTKAKVFGWTENFVTMLFDRCFEEAFNELSNERMEFIVSFCKKLLQLMPDEIDIFLLLLKIESMANIENAKKLCKARLKKDPSCVRLWDFYVVLLKNCDSDTEYLNALEKILKSWNSLPIPESFSLLLQIAEFFQIKNDASKAKSVLISPYCSDKDLSNTDYLHVLRSYSLTKCEVNSICHVKCGLLLASIILTDYRDFLNYWQQLKLNNSSLQVQASINAYSLECVFRSYYSQHQLDHKVLIGMILDFIRQYPFCSLFTDLISRIENNESAFYRSLFSIFPITVPSVPLFVALICSSRFNPNLTRSLLKQLAESPLKHCPQLSQLQIDFERRLKIVYDCIRSCPWSKDVYMTGISRLLSQIEVEKDDLVELVNVMEEKELRLCTLLEEVPLILSD